jgi:hypothetical protein
MPSRYLTLSKLLEKVDEPYRSAFQTLLSQHRGRIQAARGSTNNHQAWAGGYIDHIQEVMNIAVVLYDTVGQLRPLPFSLSDALVVLFCHDLEKPWAYVEDAGVWRRQEAFRSKEDAHAFRLKKLAECGVELPPELERAVFFAEGEVHQYSNRVRAMSPLAAFAHLCDVASARLWHDYPRERDDSWSGARRSGPQVVAANPSE